MSSPGTRASKSEEGSRQSRLPSPGTRVVPPVRLDAGGPMKVHRLLGRCLRHRLYRYVDAALGFGTELDLAIDEREQCVVLAQADVLPRVPLGAALTRDDVAGDDLLAAENLQAQALAV